MLPTVMADPAPHATKLAVVRFDEMTEENLLATATPIEKAISPIPFTQSQMSCFFYVQWSVCAVMERDLISLHLSVEVLLDTPIESEHGFIRCLLDGLCTVNNYQIMISKMPLTTRSFLFDSASWMAMHANLSFSSLLM